MKLPRRYARPAAVFLGMAALLATSCDDGIGLLTTDERRSLYKAEASGRGVSLPASADNPGVILDPSEGILVAFETLRGSEEPAELDVTLREGSGAHSVSLRYRTDRAESSTSADPSAADVRVASLAAFSRTLAVPEEFPDGYYELAMDARTARGESLSFSNISLFLIRGSLPAPSILTYPANPSPGSRVLLVANLAGYEGRDPYLRWTVDGAVRSEGLASEGRDKLFWPAPQAGSAAPVGLAVYPSAPPPGVVYSFPPPRSASAGLLVAPGGSASVDEFARADRFLALFRMEDTPDYVGRTGGSATFLGSPRLDVHPGGFGLVLGGEEGAGIRAESALVPQAAGRLLPFTILLRLVPSKSPEGVLFRAESDASGPSLELSLADGKPLAVLRSGDRAAEIRAETGLTAGRSGLLAATIRPEGRTVRVSFLVDGKPAGEGVAGFGGSGWTEAGVTIVAGPGGCAGLYDEAGVWAFDDKGDPSVYPAFRFASRREFGTALVLADGFEGRYGAEPELSGGASIDPAWGLILPSGGAVRFGDALEAPFAAEAFLASGSGLGLELSGPGEPVRLRLSAADSRPDPSGGLSVFRVRVRLAEDGAGVLVLPGAGGEIRLPGAGPWRLVLSGPGPGETVIRAVRAFRSGEDSGE